MFFSPALTEIDIQHSSQWTCQQMVEMTGDLQGSCGSLKAYKRFFSNITRFQSLVKETLGAINKTIKKEPTLHIQQRQWSSSDPILDLNGDPSNSRIRARSSSKTCALEVGSAASLVLTYESGVVPLIICFEILVFGGVPGSVAESISADDVASSVLLRSIEGEEKLS